MSAEDVAHGGGRHLRPEFGALPTDPQVSPAGILPRQQQNQLHERRIEASLGTGLTTIAPSTSYEFSMPSQHRCRCHQERRPALSRQEPGQCGQDQAISWCVAWPGNLAVQHRQLVAKDCNLDVLIVWSGTETDQPEDASYEEEDDGRGHVGHPGRLLIVAAQSRDPVLAPFRALGRLLSASSWMNVVPAREAGWRRSQCAYCRRHSAAFDKYGFWNPETGSQRLQNADAGFLVRARLARLANHLRMGLRIDCTLLSNCCHQSCSRIFPSTSLNSAAPRCASRAGNLGVPSAERKYHQGQRFLARSVDGPWRVAAS